MGTPVVFAELRGCGLRELIWSSILLRRMAYSHERKGRSLGYRQRTAICRQLFVRGNCRGLAGIERLRSQDKSQCACRSGFAGEGDAGDVLEVVDEAD
jgi:hypothetical protein